MCGIGEEIVLVRGEEPERGERGYIAIVKTSSHHVMRPDASMRFFGETRAPVVSAQRDKSLSVTSRSEDSEKGKYGESAPTQTKCE